MASSARSGCRLGPRRARWAANRNLELVSRRTQFDDLLRARRALEQYVIRGCVRSPVILPRAVVQTCGDDLLPPVNPWGRLASHELGGATAVYLPGQSVRVEDGLEPDHLWVIIPPGGPHTIQGHVEH